MSVRRTVFGALVVALAALGAGRTASAGPAGELVERGNAAYRAGQYGEALEAYDKASVDAPESPHIYFNKGGAYYRKSDFVHLDTGRFRTW